MILGSCNNYEGCKQPYNHFSFKSKTKTKFVNNFIKNQYEISNN